MIQLVFALIEKKTRMRNAQIEKDPTVFLKCEQMLKNIRVDE